ncbi:MAG: LysR substrate-binding domain-containing protein [Pseudomonadota bacterium]
MASPSFSALRVFDAAARLGSFKAAADELGVSPTAVSHQIRALEAHLGFALFVRKTRKVNLTAQGRHLAQATLGAFQQVRDALDDLAVEQRTLTVSTTPAFASLWLVPRIQDFEEANPEIRVHVDTSTAPLDLKRERHIDLAIRYGPGAYPGMRTDVLANEELAAFGSPDYLASLDDAAQVTLIETQWTLGSVPPITWNNWFAASGELLPQSAMVRSFDEEQHVINAGLAGQGLILISRLLVSDMVSRGWLRPYMRDVSVPGLTYATVMADQSAGTRKVRRFLTWIRTQSFD